MGKFIWSLLIFALGTIGARMVPPQQVIGPRIVNLDVNIDNNSEEEDVSAAIAGLVVQGILESLSDEGETSTAASIPVTSSTLATPTTKSERTTTAAADGTSSPGDTTADSTYASPTSTSSTASTTTTTASSTTTTASATTTTTESMTITTSLMDSTTMGPHESPHLIPGWATALIVIAVVAIIFALLSVLFVRYR